MKTIFILCTLISQDLSIFCIFDMCFKNGEEIGIDNAGRGSASKTFQEETDVCDIKDSKFY